LPNKATVAKISAPIAVHKNLFQGPLWLALESEAFSISRLTRG
jgi:hypothetical protein